MISPILLPSSSDMVLSRPLYTSHGCSRRRMGQRNTLMKRKDKDGIDRWYYAGSIARYWRSRWQTSETLLVSVRILPQLFPQHAVRILPHNTWLFGADVYFAGTLRVMSGEAGERGSLSCLPRTGPGAPFVPHDGAPRRDVSPTAALGAKQSSPR